MNRIKVSIAVCALLIAGNTLAGNDKSIKGDLRKGIQSSMANYISNNTVNGTFTLYDSVKGKVLQLRLDALHSGIVKKGAFYVSCADFIDQHGRKVDLDFLVQQNSAQLLTRQAIIHAISGSKRTYHLESS